MEHQVDVPGGRLFGLSDGVGPPIALLHAGIADLRSWDALAPLLEAAGYRAIRFDLRGLGRTTTEDVEFSFRSDVVATLDALGIDRAVLVGNSRGGQIALDTAIEFPERIVAVVGVAAGLGGFEGDLPPDEMALFDEMDRLENADPRDPDAIVELDIRVWVNGPRQPSDRVDARIQDAVRLMDRQQYEAHHVEGRSIRLTPRADDRLADLRCPILAIAGMLDVSDVVATARHLEAEAPNARAVLLPHVAHMIGMEAPNELAALIVEFVAPLRPWA